MDPVALAAHGESLWHRLGLAALGIGWVEDGEVARRARPSSPVFLGALSLRAGVPAAQLAQAVEPLAGGLAATFTPGAVHPPAASLRVPGLTLLLARLDGQPVGAAIAASDATVLNVAGVAVLEKARRQGIGTQLTLACLATAPHLPAVLSSSDDGHPLYRTLGFHDVGPTTLWWRPAHRAT